MLLKLLVHIVVQHGTSKFEIVTNMTPTEYKQKVRSIESFLEMLKGNGFYLEGVGVFTTDTWYSIRTVSAYRGEVTNRCDWKR